MTHIDTIRAPNGYASAEWPEVRLGDLVQIKHGWPFKSELFSESLTGRPIVVNIGNFQYTGGFRFESTAIKEYRGEYPGEYELRPGEILLVMTCQTSGGEILGIPARVPNDGRIYLHNQRLGRVIVTRPDLVNDHFLYWLFLWSAFNRELFVTATGTKILHTAPTRIENFRFRLPSLSEQAFTARLLDDLDNKIELNRRMNETLEAMARTLFKSWFIDFDPVHAKAAVRRQHPAWSNAQVSRAALPNVALNVAELFPDTFEDSALSPIPAGWQTRSLHAIADFVNGAAFKNEDFCDHSDGLPVIKIAELKHGITAQTNYSKKDIGESRQITRGHLLYSWSGSPDTSLDVFRWTGPKGLLNQHIFNVITTSVPDRIFAYYLLKHLRPTLIEIARNKQTTGLGHVTVEDMQNLHVLAPPADILSHFASLAGPHYDLSFDLEIESAELAKIRDELLPRLLSGELSASESVGSRP